MSPNQGSDFIAVLVTAAGVAESERVAERLVEESLAACVNVIGPIRSIYTWEGKLQREEEYLLVIKTQMAQFEALETRVRELHSYSTPEIIALPIRVGSKPYLDWVVRALNGAPE